MKAKNNKKTMKKKGSSQDKTTKLCAVGNLHLKLDLKINDEYLERNNIKFDDLSSYESIAFLKDSKELWSDIQISSNNASMNILLQVNKSTKQKVFLEYIVMSMIKYSEEQEKFKELVTYVTENNFLFLRESDACECNTDIILYLLNGTKCKSFNLCEAKNLSVKSGEDDDKKEKETKEDKKEEEQVKDKEKDNIGEQGQNQEQAVDENKDNNVIQSNEEEAQQKEKEEQTQVNLKKESNGEEAKEDEERANPFTRITEAKFTNFDYIFIDLTDFSETELATNIKSIDILKFIQHLKINTSLKIIINFPNLVSKSMTVDDVNAIDQILLLTDIYLFERKNAYRIFNVIHLFNDSNGTMKDLDKRKDIDFFVNQICFQCPVEYKVKIGIFMDEFNKVTIAQIAPNSKPIINELDALIHPKVNHYNMRTVDEYKSILSSSYETYASIFYGAFIGKLIQGDCSDRSVYISYLTGIESAKKILELHKNGLDLPKEKEFYIVKLPIGKVDENLQKQCLRQKEGRFVLDCVNEQQSKLRYYNPLFDHHLTSFFTSNVNKKELKNKGFINTNGFILYDAVYREMLGSSPKRKRNEDIDNDMLLNTIHSIKVTEKISNKEINSHEALIKKNAVLKKKLPVIHSDMYKTSRYSKSRQLPPIANRTSGNDMKESKTINQEEESKAMYKTAEN